METELIFFFIYHVVTKLAGHCKKYLSSMKFSSETDVGKLNSTIFGLIQCLIVIFQICINLLVHVDSPNLNLLIFVCRMWTIFPISITKRALIANVHIKIFFYKPQKNMEREPKRKEE